MFIQCLCLKFDLFIFFSFLRRQLEDKIHFTVITYIEVNPSCQFISLFLFLYKRFILSIFRYKFNIALQAMKLWII